MSERGELMARLEREVGPFLAHDPDRPEAFYGGLADAILRAGFGKLTAADETATETHVSERGSRE